MSRLASQSLIHRSSSSSPFPVLISLSSRTTPAPGQPRGTAGACAAETSGEKTTGAARHGERNGTERGTIRAATEVAAFPPKSFHTGTRSLWIKVSAGRAQLASGILLGAPTLTSCRGSVSILTLRSMGLGRRKQPHERDGS